MPTNLAVMPVKRFWSGDMTNARLRDEMWRVKPELILLKNETRQSPFSDLVDSQYLLVYEDTKHRLLVSKGLDAKVRKPN
jgi:hypothetical protein